MAWAHGKRTVITLDSEPIVDCNTSEETREADEHDLTMYGDDWAANEGGIKRGGATLGGKYLVGATGASAIIPPLVGTNVVMTVEPEGTGTGKPLITVTVHVKKFVSTKPVADYISWSAEVTYDGPPVDSTQA